MRCNARPNRRLATLVAWAAVLLSHGVPADAAVLETWQDFFGCLEGRGLKVVAPASMVGPLPSPGEVGDQAVDDAEVSELARANGAVSHRLSDDVVVLRGRLGFEPHSPVDLSVSQREDLRTLRVLAGLSDEQKRRLAFAPVRIADLPEGARERLAHWGQGDRGLRGDVPEPDSLLVLYAPWLVVADEMGAMRIPLRADDDAWSPYLVREGDDWFYPDADRAIEARVPDVPFLHEALFSPALQRVEGGIVPLALAMGGLVELAGPLADELDTEVYLTGGEYPRGVLLSALLEAERLAIRELPDGLVSVVKAQPTQDPSEPTQRRLQSALSGIASSLAPAYDAFLSRELGADIAALRSEEGAAYADLPPAFGEHVYRLMARAVEVRQAQHEAAPTVALTPESRVRVDPGLLVAVALLSDAGEWLTGRALLLDPVGALEGYYVARRGS